MSRFKPNTIHIIILFIGLWATTTTNAQTIANGPYYATPSWNLKIPCDTPSQCLRFIVLANWDSQAVLDRETGLIWERSARIELVDLAAAKLLCAQATTGGRFGWRLPNIQESMSLFIGTAFAPTLPPGHPFMNALIVDPIFGIRGYWTSTIRAPGSVGKNYRAPFASGDIFEQANVWCVRGAE